MKFEEIFFEQVSLQSEIIHEIIVGFNFEIAIELV